MCAFTSDLLASTSPWKNPLNSCERKPSRPASYKSQDGSRHPRLQLLTIKDLLEGNKNVQRPLHVREVTFKKAPRSRPQAAQNLSLNLSNGE